MKHFGDLFRHQRENKRLSQTELASLSSLTVDSIRAIETRQVLPSKIQMERLAAVAKLALSYQEMQQWKANEIQAHEQALSPKISIDQKWQCPNRRWDCPCCLWPYTLQCELTNRSDATPDRVVDRAVPSD